MVLMLLNAITEHKDIIEVHMYENADVFLKDMVHEPLKSWQCITISLLHNKAFVDSLDCRKCGLPHVLRFHLDLFIDVQEIQFWIYFHSSNVKVNHVLIREQCDILHYVIISLMHAYNHAYESQFLEDNKHGCSLFSPGRLPLASMGVFPDFFSKRFSHWLRAAW